jgi:hypothetical protein
MSLSRHIKPISYLQDNALGRTTDKDLAFSSIRAKLGL